VPRGGGGGGGEALEKLIRWWVLRISPICMDGRSSIIYSIIVGKDCVINNYTVKYV